MRALQVLPGIVVYPINGVGTIMLSAITSMLLWKERLTRSNYAFLALASVALLLIYPR
jgi:multidrug transporter EmrE-like cation transporter